MTLTPFAARGSNGIVLNDGPSHFSESQQFTNVESTSCKTMLFSPDGEYFAYVNGLKLTIVCTTTWNNVAVIDGIKPSYLAFSPKSTFLMTWEQFYVTKDDPQGKANLNIFKSATGELVKGFTHKKQFNWQPQFSFDEKLFSRIVNNDVVFYEDLNFEKIVARINCFKVTNYGMSPNLGTYFVLCYVPGSSGQPSSGKIFKYPNFETTQTVASKSFFQADKVDILWNGKGNNALLLASTDVDKTGGSYYGKQSLHFFGINGHTALVSMSKEGPIYSVAWSPKNHEFCVIYGFVPARATLYNLKCEPVFEFGTGSRNSIYYNLQGNFILLGGFGNLRGQVEIWDAVNRKIIGTCDASDSTLLEWCPDGKHFLTATTAPRLRIGNGYKVWHYSGALLHENAIKEKEELYEVCWKNFPKYTFQDPVVTTEKVSGIVSSQPVASKQAYRPPSARNRPAVSFKLNDEETAHKPGGETQSKASLKQKKKRDAKKAKKLEEDDKSPTTPAALSSVQIILTGDPEKDKKLKTIKKKLDAIEKLKELQAQGKTLEVNQIAKIKGEGELLEELEHLQI